MAPLSGVSVIVVSWNARAQLARCLTSLDAHRHQVILVDNASEDGSAQVASNVSPGIEVLRLTDNVGFAGAVNAGARHATGTSLLLLNPDAIPVSGAIERLASSLTAAPAYGAMGGQLVDVAGRPQVGFTLRRFPTLAVWAADLLLVDQVWPTNPVTRRYLDLTQAQEVDQPAAACLMVRRSAFDALGGMDETFFPAWFEDVDFCRRLRKAGWRIGYEPAARVAHEGGVAMRQLGLASFSRAWYGNMLRYARKHHGAGTRVTLRVLIVVGMLLRMGVSLARGRLSDARAYGAVLRDTLRGRI